ncbi:MAG: hypothetical protein K5930_03510 [Treponemataceae bacterium]|nr:hypothetical protein [Treponemataceae bacterium]
MKGLKKKSFVLLCMVFLFSSIHAAELSCINYDNLKNFEAYRNDFIFAYNHQDYFSSYVFDDYWNLNYSRAECVDKLTSLYQLILEKEEPENQDYLLLRGVIAAYLYNLDATEFYSDAVEAFVKIQELPEYDYRCLWFLGNFYVDSLKLEDGLALYNQVTELVPEEYLHPSFFYDYGMALHVASMPMRAMNAFEKYEKYSGNSIKENSIYNFEKNLVHEYDGSDKDSDMLMLGQIRNGKKGVILRPFGLWFSLPENWDVKLSGFAEKLYMLQSNLTAKKSDGVDVGYSTLLISSLSDTIEETSAYKQFLSFFDRFPNNWEVSMYPDRQDITVFEYSDASMYPDLGGAHGYAVLVVKPWMEGADLEMETCLDVSRQMEEGTQFYTMRDFYKRYKGYAVHFFILDTCEAILEESKEQFFDFLDTCQFF